MRLDFDVATDLAPDQVYDYFSSPTEWPRLFTAFDEATELRSGWVKIPIRRSPFSLFAKVTFAEPDKRVAWVIRGFWRGRGEVCLQDLQDGTHITGYEKVDPPRLLGWSGLLQRWAEPRFDAVWETGWRRIRRNVISESH